MLEKAVWLGIVEGLTEFIPVSSTGHLILFGNLIGFSGAIADSFDVFIQLGAILAVVVLYWKRFTSLLDFSAGLGARQGFKGVAGLSKLFVACLPAFVSGFFLHGLIKEKLFNPTSVAVALILGGIVLIWVERRAFRPGPEKSIEQIDLKLALLIGLFQCLALWPGISRSGATIVGGMLLGLDRRVAAEFSFLVAVPVMLAATSLDLIKSLDILQFEHLQLFVVGFIVSFITAWAAIKFFINLLGRMTLAPFGWYRIVLGCLVLYFAV